MPVGRWHYDNIIPMNWSGNSLKGSLQKVENSANFRLKTTEIAAVIRSCDDDGDVSGPLYPGSVPPALELGHLCWPESRTTIFWCRRPRRFPCGLNSLEEWSVNGRTTPLGWQFEVVLAYL